MIFILEESLVCVYCLEEFAVTSYRTYNNSGANFKSFSVYVYCTNKQTCKDIYLCLEVSFLINFMHIINSFLTFEVFVSLNR